MTFRYILLPFLLLLASVAYSSDEPAYGRDFERRFSESFAISGNGTVKLSNRYGEINVTTWSQSRVKIDVLVTANVSDQDDFDELLERIDIQLRKSGNTVSGTTEIDNASSGGFWEMIFGGTFNNDFKIYYTVSMPRSVQLEVDARYCDVDLPDLDGETDLDVGYGDLVAGRLRARSEVSVSYGSLRMQSVGDDSSIRMRYSEGSLNRAGNLRYDGRYSEINIDEAGDLTLDVGYEDIEIGTAGEVRLDGNYNDFSLERATRVYLDGNYTDFNIGTVTEILEVDTNYGDIEVDQLSSGFQRVDIDAGYADVDIDLQEGGGFELDLEARYGDIDAPEDRLENRQKISEGSTEKLSGHTGSGGGLIRIRTSYGDIEIY